jgi:hypothetical protein
VADDIDARVLARCQKDLDGFIEQYQQILDKRVAIYATEIQPTWGRIARKITQEVKAIITKQQDANLVPIRKEPIDPAKQNNMDWEVKRLKTLQQLIVKTLKTGENTQKLKNNLIYQYAHSFYYHAFKLEQAAGVKVNVPFITLSQIMGVVDNPWLPDKVTYGHRIRTNTAFLAKKMKAAIEEAVGKGWGVNKTARLIQQTAKEGFYNAVRLARTELTMQLPRVRIICIWKMLIYWTINAGMQL